MDGMMINRTLGIVLTDDGQTLPITHFFDSLSEECAPDEAVSCVAGPDANGLWVAVDLTEFDEAVLQ